MNFLVTRAGADAGLSPAAVLGSQQPAAVYTYDLGDGAKAARTIHRGIPGDNPNESHSQGGTRVEVFDDGHVPDIESAAMKSGALAANQTTKQFLAGIPYGGGKADIFVPRSVFESRDRFHEVLGSFVTQHAPHILRGDGIGPDMNMGPADMDHMAGVMVGITRNPEDAAMFTGKSVANLGVPGRGDATSRGTMVAMREFLDAQDETLVGKTIAIEGSGNVGYHLANMAHKAGMRVMGMSDVSGAVVVHDLKNGGLVPGKHIKFAGKGIEWHDEMYARSSPRPKDLHSLDVDLLVLAGPSGSVIGSDVNRIAAPVSVFAANTPYDWEAIVAYEGRGGIILPDPITNPGGVIGSYIERSSKGSATEQEVHEQIDTRIIAAARAVIAAAPEPSQYLRTTFKLGQERLFELDNAHRG